MTKTTQYFLGYIFILFVFSCANPITPQGGPRDSDPPKILSTLPKNKSIGVQPAKILIRFDEYIVLENPTQNISISPPVEGTIEFLVKGKSLEVKLPNEPLRENTTYTINFGAAIKDNNEGNIQDSFNFVFSTGQYLDSLSVSGLIIDAETSMPEEGFVVGLYINTDDSVIYKQKPDYYTKTKKDGAFLIQNLKEKPFKIVAFKDENFNFIKDLPIEKLAFQDNLVVPVNEPIPITLKSFAEPQPIKMVESFTRNQGVMKFVFSEATQQFNLAPTKGQFSLNDTAYYFNTQKDTVLFYYSFNTQKTDSFVAYINCLPSDTISVNFKHTSPDSIRLLLPPIGIFTPIVSSSRRQLPSAPTPQEVLQDFEKPFKIKINRPIKAIDESRVVLLHDTTQNIIPFSVKEAPPLKFLFHVEQPEKIMEASQYEIQFKDSALLDYYGMYNKAFSVKYKTTKKEDYGESIITIDSIENNKQYVLLFLDGKDEVVAREIIKNTNSATYRYKKLLPGTYKLKLIDDTNYNEKWDTGDYLLKRQPESILVFPEKIEVRANWQNEVVFKVNASKNKRGLKGEIDIDEGE